MFERSITLVFDKALDAGVRNRTRITSKVKGAKELPKLLLPPLWVFRPIDPFECVELVTPVDRDDIVT
jgi:hypothetical protein